MDRSDTDVYTRRGVLKTGAGVAATGAVAASTVGTASAQEDIYGGYLTDADTDGGAVTETADATGNDEVTVQVGRGNNGWKFNPGAVLVDPGTTVIWEWVGNGGGHNVIHETENEFASATEQLFNSGDPVSDEGATFEHTFEDEAARQYFCSPHKGVGMKGVVAVGEDNAEGDIVDYALSGGPTGLSTPVIGGAGAFGVVSLLGIAAYNALVENTDDSGSHLD